MATKLNFGRDINGYNAYAPKPSTVKYRATLTTGDVTSVSVPETSATWIVSFRYFPNDVWVDVSGATATVPSSNELTASTAELNPASLELSGGTNISMITAQDTADVSIVMWPVSYA